MGDPVDMAVKKNPGHEPCEKREGSFLVGWNHIFTHMNNSSEVIKHNYRCTSDDEIESAKQASVRSL